MRYISEHKEGFWGTVVVHALVLVLLLVFGFFTPLPLPGEEGILVNFGNSKEGLGNKEPGPAPQKSKAVPAAEEKVAIQSPPPAVPPPTASKVKEEVMTQNYEKTVAIESAAEAEARKKKEELERQNKLAEQRRLQEQRERERQMEIARQQREAEQKQIDKIHSRVANAFGPGKASGEKSTGQGVTFPSGNQGSPDGSPASETYGPGGSASGSSGNGPSFSLSGRNALSLPKPAYPGNEEGTVVVAVTVDKYGKVTQADAGVQGSTTYQAALVRAAREAALRARFNPDPNAAAFQKGTITYRFVLD